MWTALSLLRASGFAESSHYPEENWWDRLGRLWCNWTHPPPMWPIHGRYICRKCMRSHPIPWSNSDRHSVVPSSTRVLTRMHPKEQF